MFSTSNQTTNLSCAALSPYLGETWHALDALLIVPPISLLDTPHLGLHTLQAVSRDAGFKVRILYADQLFAKAVGLDIYEILGNSLMSPYEQFGERLFCAQAFDLPLLGHRTDEHGLTYTSPRSNDNFKQIAWSDILALTNQVDAWLDVIVGIVAQLDVPLVGIATSHQQTSAAIALLRRIKVAIPNTITCLGGSNCHGEMADGLASASDFIDYIFAGEAESAWLDLLRNARTPNRFSRRVIPNTPCMKLDDLPEPDFSDYFEQRNENELPPSDIWINLETSRGCWWGQKYLCTFCGINGDTLKYRVKSPNRVLHEITQVVTTYPGSKLRMTDVLMPRHYFKKVLPQVANNLPGLTIFYEQRADLSLSEVSLLNRAGVKFIQVGIEHFSTPLLRLINKGITGQDNINLLRYARSVGCAVGWNLLSAVPGDTEEDWVTLLRVISAIRHLSPPTLLRPVEITRFSPYFDTPERFGISNIRPLDVYADIFPAQADLSKIAWLFTADYESYSGKCTELMNAIRHEVEAWKQAWMVPVLTIPTLEIHRYASGKFILRDTRKLCNLPPIQFLNENEASVALLGDRSPYFWPLQEWATIRRLTVELDGRFVPLATAEPDLLMQFEAMVPTEKLAWRTRTSDFTIIRAVS